MMLSDAVTVTRRFQRSVRIDTDLGAPAALYGFVCQGSGSEALKTMSRLIIDAGQCAFTWTGPYGGGKSSLALALAAAVGRDTGLRKVARDLLGEAMEPIDQAFPSGGAGWLVTPVVGRRADPIDDLEISLAGALGKRRKATRAVTDAGSGRVLISRLQDEAAARDGGGVLVLIDEMGKFLEAAAAEGNDIHFFQELAEASGRSAGRLVVIGILHQSFDQYATRLSSEARDEWAKVQGRFVDIPIISAVDEVIDLLGRAIEVGLPHPESEAVAAKVGAAISRRRPGSPDDLAQRLDAAWPLHPVVAALLGPVSRRRFGQNERSTFGFLGSSEPEGFQEFLRRTPANQPASYDPAQLWDYLRINLEPAILASPDGHRWAQGVDAVERCEARGTPLHIRLAKTIALIDLFRNGTGIVAERDIVRVSLADVDAFLVDRALADLEQWSIIIFRKHIDAWAVYAGSDFDIEAAVGAAQATVTELNLQRLAELVDLQPLLAKQHYTRTGALRWFRRELVSVAGLRQRISELTLRDGASGAILLAIPTASETRNRALAACRAASSLKCAYPFTIGLPWNARVIRDLGTELIALETVQATRPELEGDGVARREITARISAISAQLEEELRAAFGDATWYVGGNSDHDGGPRALARLVSRLADETFAETLIIHSELINRERPSGNSQAAVRQLLHAMVNSPDQAYLGIEGFPAERGLYSTVLEVSGLHRWDEHGYKFCAPTEKIAPSFIPLWHRAEELLATNCDIVPMSDLYQVWAAPPFGVRRGVLPILALAFTLAQRSTVAVYAQGVFRPELDSYVADLLLQDERLLGLRRVDLKGENQSILLQVASAIDALIGETTAREPLAVARALVRFAIGLPVWAQKTVTLSEPAKEVRRVLLSASDPHRALFVDLPLAFPAIGASELGSRLSESLKELGDAYPLMLGELKRRLLDALGHRSELAETLQQRAGTVFGLTGDLRLDAFAGRLMSFGGATHEIEGLAGFALNKPPRDWSDRDPDRAALELAELALRFRHAEALAGVKNRAPTRHALAVVFGTGESGRTVMRSVDIADSEREEVSGLTEGLLAVLNGAGVDARLMMAALAEAGARAVDGDEAAVQIKDLV
jgi:hypothetical protein